MHNPLSEKGCRLQKILAQDLNLNWLRMLWDMYKFKCFCHYFDIYVFETLDFLSFSQNLSTLQKYVICQAYTSFFETKDSQLLSNFKLSRQTILGTKTKLKFTNIGISTVLYLFM